MPRLNLLQRRSADYVELARAESRALEVPQIDPRNHDPNANPATGSVGPHASVGEIMHAEAWDGWPRHDGRGHTWGTPWMEPLEGEWSGFGYGRQNPESYLKRVSSVMTCTDLTSRTLATMPIYGARGISRLDLPDWRKNPQPEQYGSWIDFAKVVVNSMLLKGEAIIWATARYADGYPARFMALNPDWVKITPDGAGGWNYALGKEPLERRDVCHIRYQTLAGRARGIGPLEWANRSVVSAATLERYAADIARYGVWAVLKHPANLDSTQSEDLKARWLDARQGTPGAPAVLSGGVEFETVSLSPHDMALLDLRTFDEQRIASALGVPPWLAGLPNPGGGLTYTTTHQLTDFWWRSSLRALAQSIATPLSAWALPGDQRIEFDRDEFLRPEPATLATFYSTMHSILDEQTGERAMTVDEIRVRERFTPSARAAATTPTEVLTP
jgi:HK97 family phage portal protein